MRNRSSEFFERTGLFDRSIDHGQDPRAVALEVLHHRNQEFVIPNKLVVPTR